MWVRGSAASAALRGMTLHSFLCLLRLPRQRPCGCLHVKSLFDVNIDFIEAGFVERVGVAGVREEDVGFQGLERIQEVGREPDAVDAA